MKTQTFGDSTLAGVCTSYEPEYIHGPGDRDWPGPVIGQQPYTGRLSLFSISMICCCIPLLTCAFPCQVCLEPCDENESCDQERSHRNPNGDEIIHFSPGYIPLVYLSRITCLPSIFLELFYPFAFAPSPGKHERFAPHRNEACLDYRKNRENGDTCDDPSRPFPNDGKYAWATPREGRSKVRYTEGSGDKAWMEEKDKNYLARLERENVNSEDTPLKLSI